MTKLGLMALLLLPPRDFMQMQPISFACLFFKLPGSAQFHFHQIRTKKHSMIIKEKYNKNIIEQ